jgi:hypothetical protein
MSVEKIQRDITDLFNYPSDPNPTTQADYITAVKNWVGNVINLVDIGLWQPETAYAVGAIVRTPSLPVFVLKCITAGTSDVTEPDYTDVREGDTIQDNNVEWVVCTLNTTNASTKANADASNIGVNAETDNSDLWGSAIGGGEIAEDDGKLVTGGTVHAVTSVLASDIADNTDDIATNTDNIAQNATDIGIADKRISNIEKLLQGHLYDYQTDNTSAYAKTVPSGAMPYAGLEKVGGKTVVWNQLVDSDTTAVSTISGHKYYTLIDGTASIVTSSGSAITIVDDSADMVCDLTLMFGSGNEQSTTAEFTAIFGATHYPYNAGTLLSAGVTKVVSKDSNNATLQTYSIPAEVQALEGYGWSAGSVYNYVDFERKVFVQNVAKKDISASDISLVTYVPYTNITYYRVSKPVNYSGYGKYADAKTACPVINNRFISINRPPSYDATDNINCIDGAADRNLFWFGFAKGTVLADAQSVLAGTSIYYQLATPVETDISEYLTDDNLIQVDSGGTLTFLNQNGTDYCIPVPSEEEYMIDLQEAINNG